MVHTWNKAKQYASPAIKGMLLILCLYAIYYQITTRNISIATTRDILSNLSWFTLPVMVALSLSSWLVESIKWMWLTRDIEKLRFRESVTQNLSAQAASFITPLRSGEFAAKALFFNSDQKKIVVERVLMGNLSQMLVTTAMGCVALFFYSSVYVSREITLYLSLAVITIGCTVYYIYGKSLNVPRAPLALWSKTILLSLVRYLLFSGCWYMVLSQISSLPLSYVELFPAIAVFYLLISVLPMMQILDIPVKMTVAGIVFSLIGDLEKGIAAATVVVWCTNTILPTLLGCILLPRRDLKALRA